MMNRFSIAKNIPRTIFRAYDIRGIVGETITPDIIYAIACAVAKKTQAAGKPIVIVARDGRLSSDVLAEALREGLLDGGCDVIDIGAVPSPLLYYATHVLPTNSGVMLTASHNPSNYNGLKITVNGEAWSEQAIQELYQSIVQQDFPVNPVRGKLTQQDVMPAYIQHIMQTIVIKKPLKIVVDCGNSIAGVIGPKLLRAFGCEVTELYCNVDGNFPNHEPDPSQEKNLADLKSAVLVQKADLGIAFDGDMDRLGVVSPQGEVIWPDRQMMLYAIDVLSRNPGATIIYDIKCTGYVAKIIEQHGGQALMWKTGHSFMKAKMRETGALLAGEMSGHIFFKERWFGFDDGLYTAARLLEILSANPEAFTQLAREVPASIDTPEFKIPMADEKKFDFMKQLIAQVDFPNAEKITLDGLRVEFKEGWGLVRPSNTSPYIVARFEGSNQDNLQYILKLFREALLEIDDNLAIPF